MGLADRQAPTAQEYADYRKRFSNWGRWGEDDELGTLNFITPEVRRQAAELVSEGRSLSLSRPLDTHAGPANPYPAHHFVAVGDSGGMLDYFGMFIHGITNTHIDALCHLATLEGDRIYNGAEMAKNGMPVGHRGTIEHWRDGIVTRGVLYDVPRLRGGDYLEPGQPLQGWELADAANAQGIEPRPGDAVVIRSGADAYLAGRSRASVPRWACTLPPASFSSRARPRCSAGISRMRPPPTRASRIPSTSTCLCTSTTSCCPTWACRSSTTRSSRAWRRHARSWAAGSSSSWWRRWYSTVARVRP